MAQEVFIAFLGENQSDEFKRGWEAGELWQTLNQTPAVEHQLRGEFRCDNMEQLFLIASVAGFPVSEWDMIVGDDGKPTGQFSATFKRRR